MAHSCHNVAGAVPFVFVPASTVQDVNLRCLGGLALLYFLEGRDRDAMQVSSFAATSALAALALACSPHAFVGVLRCPCAALPARTCPARAACPVDAAARGCHTLHARQCTRYADTRTRQGARSLR